MLSLVALALAVAPLPRAPLAQDSADRIGNRRTPLVEVIEQVRPSVVSIDVNVKDRTGWGVFRPAQLSSGSGVVLFEDGVIVTNAHVVAPNGQYPDEILVRFDAADDTRVYPGSVISFDAEEDLALVRIEGDEPFPVIRLADSPAMLGETVIAIGNALGQTHTVSTGIISGLHRDLDVHSNLHFRELLQTDAAINPGNSGGPLLDVNGDLLGINVAITREAENIGFAIPVSRVQTVLEQKLLDPSQATAYLGYEVDENTFRVTSVNGLGPADNAGLRVGDRIRAINGAVLKDAESYRIKRLSIELGRPAAFEIERDGSVSTIELRPWDRVQGLIHQRLGVRVNQIKIDVTPAGWTRGRRLASYLELTSVDPNGPAGRINLAEGDVIAAVKPARHAGARKLQTATELAFVLYQLEPDSAVDIEIWRDDDGNGSLTRSDTVSELYSGTLRLR